MSPYYGAERDYPPPPIVCWHNGRPMGHRTACTLRDQLAVIEEGERVAIHEALTGWAQRGEEPPPPHVPIGPD